MAFDHLKQAIISAPVLIMPNFTKQFEVKCDASGYGVGAVLIQQGQHIAYFSTALSAQTMSTLAYDCELMALAFAIEHWQPYLLEQKFVVRTDQRNLRHLLEQQIVTPVQQCWIYKFLHYKFVIEYKLEHTIRAADSLSHQGDIELNALSHPRWIDLDELQVAVHSCSFLRESGRISP